MDFSTSLYKGENDLLYQNTSTLIPENSTEFFDVSFRYHNGNQILRHLTAKFLTNKINAIVGESGSGKSTMLSLLMRLYDVDLGEIKLNGINRIDTVFAHKPCLQLEFENSILNFFA